MGLDVKTGDVLDGVARRLCGASRLLAAMAAGEDVDEASREALLLLANRIEDEREVLRRLIDG